MHIHTQYTYIYTHIYVCVNIYIYTQCTNSRSLAPMTCCLAASSQLWRDLVSRKQNKIKPEKQIDTKPQVQMALCLWVSHCQFLFSDLQFFNGFMLFFSCAQRNWIHMSVKHHIWKDWTITDICWHMSHLSCPMRIDMWYHVLWQYSWRDLTREGIDDEPKSEYYLP